MELPENYLSLQNTVAKYFGIDFHSEHEAFAYQIYSKLILVVFLYISTLIEAFSAYCNLYRVDYLLVILSYLIHHAAALVQTMVVFVNRKKIGKIITRLHSGVFAPNKQRGGSAEADEIHKIIKATRAQFIAFNLITAGGMFNATVMSINTRLQTPPENWDVPFVTKFELFDPHSSPNFEIAFAIQSVIIYGCSTLISCIDLTITAVLAHLSGQLRILQNSFRNLNKVEILHQCVEHHVEIINIKNEIEEVFNVPILFNLIANVGQLCFVIYQASTASFGVTFFLKICHCLFVAFQFYIYCYWCNEITVESGNVATAAAECEWLNENIYFQKKLIMVMARSQDTLKITAGKIVVLSMMTFMSLIRSSVSYFMVLRHFRN